MLTLHNVAMRIVLIGAAGAGKSSVGAALAEQLGVPLREVDAGIVELAGMAIPDIFLTEGESGYRRYEAATITKLLADPKPAVIAFGASSLATPTVRELLTQATADRAIPAVVVWLQVTAPNAISRTGLNAIRPAALGNIRRQFADHLATASVLYQQAANISVATDHRGIPEICTEIIAKLPVSPSA